MKLSKTHISSELKKLRWVIKLLCLGKGSLSDYLLMAIVAAAGIGVGYWIWGV